MSFKSTLRDSGRKLSHLLSSVHETFLSHPPDSPDWRRKVESRLKKLLMKTSGHLQLKHSAEDMVPGALISPLLFLFVSRLLFDLISQVLIQAIHFGKNPSSVFLSQAL